METLISALPWIGAGLILILDVWASVHVILNKRDHHAAIAWVGLIWLVPLLGCLLYFLFGINRIRRKALKLRQRRPRVKRQKHPEHHSEDWVASREAIGETHLPGLARLVDQVTGHPLLRGNHVQPLQNGDQAYPAMLAAIHEAKRSITFSTYIFDNDVIGKRFLEAFKEAVARGIETRVLIDDIGAHYSWPSILKPLRQAGVPVASFLPRLIPAYLPYANLRNHRKTLVVDGRIGFTGGMNLRAGHDLTLPSREPIQDLHFRIEGPVVAHLQEVFADDWHFSTGKILHDDRWFPMLGEKGPVLARGILSGPDDNHEHLRWAYLGALACATKTVRIVTPYFLPDYGLTSALNSAAMRGIQVDIVLPQKNNLRFVQWASISMLWQVLQHGCRVWATPPPFDHTKLLLVDGVWTLLGSANWDPRSLRLNFEFNVECYNRELAAKLETIVQEKLKDAQPVTLADVDGRSLPVKLRDGVVRLFTPYL
jgi:cardiolipin synthase